jgi:RNA polymerase sigma-70 factor (ECF subfamily)
VVHVFHRAIALSIIRALGQPDASHADRVDELIQEVYVRLCLDNFRILRESRAERPAALVSLVQAVAATTVIDQRRIILAQRRGGEMRHVPLQEAIGCNPVDSAAEERMERESLIQKIEEALKELCRRTGKPLPECRDRHIFWLHFRQGCTAKEIAAIPELKLTPKGVESAIHRIVSELRRFFGEDREGQTP